MKAHPRGHSQSPVAGSNYRTVRAALTVALGACRSNGELVAFVEAASGRGLSSSAGDVRAGAGGGRSVAVTLAKMQYALPGEGTTLEICDLVRRGLGVA